jgi:hypothetical protein
VSYSKLTLKQEKVILDIFKFKGFRSVRAAGTVSKHRNSRLTLNLGNLRLNDYNYKCKKQRMGKNNEHIQ